jgi:hypothetical protein
MPNTGVIRSYDFTIARGEIAPDGYQKQVILINGQFPGPPIEANWGDTIQVTVSLKTTRHKISIRLTIGIGTQSDFGTRRRNVSALAWPSAEAEPVV